MKAVRPTLLVALVALFLSPQLVAAQGKKKKKSNRTNVRASGVIKGIARGVMLMESEDGDRYYVRAAGRRAKFAYTAKADASWLYPGLMIQFRGKVTKKGKVLEPVEELAVFTASKETKLGVKQDLSTATSKLFRDVPDDSKKKTKKSKTKKKTRRGKRAVPGVPYVVTGKLFRLKNGEMTVIAPGIVIKAKVAETAKISVDVKHARWVRIGDKVSVNGYYVGDKKQYVTASRIAVTAEKKLVSKKKIRSRKRKKSTRSRPRRKPIKSKKKEKTEKKDTEKKKQEDK